MGGDIRGDGKGLLGVESVLGLHLTEVLGSEGSSVNSVGSLLCRTEADDSFDLDHRRLVGDLAGLGDGRTERIEVGKVSDGLNVPPVRLISHRNVLSKGELRGTVDGDVVVIVEDDELAEAEVASEGGGLGGYALLEAAVAADYVGEVVDNRVGGLVEGGSEVLRWEGRGVLVVG